MVKVRRFGRVGLRERWEGVGLGQLGLKTRVTSVPWMLLMLLVR